MLRYSPWPLVASVMALIATLGGYGAYRKTHAMWSCQAELAYLVNRAHQTEQAMLSPLGESEINMKAVRAGHDCDSYTDDEVRRLATSLGFIVMGK